MDEIEPQRVESLRKALGLSQAALASLVGTSQATIQRIEAGETRHFRKILRLAEVLQTTPEFLTLKVHDPSPRALADRQLPFLGPGQEAERSDLVELAEFDVSYGLGGAYIHDRQVEARMRTFSRSWVRQFTASPFESLFWATGNGTSMMPAILENDILLVDTMQRTPRMWDQFWAIDMHGMGMIKALRPGKENSMRIISINPDWPEEPVYDGEMNIVGRVVAIVRKV